MSYPPQPPQGQQPYGQYAPAQPKTSGLAIAGFVMALAMIVLIWFLGYIGWAINLAAFILSVVANSQIKKSNGQLTGKGFAVAGIVITSVLFGIMVLLFLFAAAFIGSILGAM